MTHDCSILLEVLAETPMPLWGARRSLWAQGWRGGTALQRVPGSGLWAPSALAGGWGKGKKPLPSG